MKSVPSLKHNPGIESWDEQDNPLGSGFPKGCIKIKENGKFDIKEFAEAEVKVEGGVTPTGKINITENGEYDVTTFASANVNVEGIVPTGSLTITENGDYDVVELASVTVDVPSGPVTPTEPPVKGDLINFGGHKYRVLKANGWDIEVMLMDLCGSKFYASSPGSEGKVEFTCGEETKEGLKYAGSDLDTYCNETFYNSLPEEVKAAIIEQEVVQDMWDLQATAENCDMHIEKADPSWGEEYRIRKANTVDIVVGNRKVYSLSCKHILDYLGAETTNAALNEMVFGFGNTLGCYAWTSSAYADGWTYACYVIGDLGRVFNSYFGDYYVARPTFHINLEDIGWNK